MFFIFVDGFFIVIYSTAMVYNVYNIITLNYYDVARYNMLVLVYKAAFASSHYTPPSPRSRQVRDVSPASANV